MDTDPRIRSMIHPDPILFLSGIQKQHIFSTQFCLLNTVGTITAVTILQKSRPFLILVGRYDNPICRTGPPGYIAGGIDSS
jgi:hypothetical protein